MTLSFPHSSRRPRPQWAPWSGTGAPGTRCRPSTSPLVFLAEEKQRLLVAAAQALVEHLSSPSARARTVGPQCGGRRRLLALTVPICGTGSHSRRCECTWWTLNPWGNLKIHKSRQMGRSAPLAVLHFHDASRPQSSSRPPPQGKAQLTSGAGGSVGAGTGLAGALSCRGVQDSST